MNKIFYLSLAIAGIFFLYFLSSLSKPHEIEIQDIWKYNGKNVIVTGKVENVMGNVIEIGNGKARGKIYWRGEGIEYGDEIRVCGRVGEYRGEFYIYADEVKICKKWNDDNVSISYLAENFYEYIGKKVNVTGYVYSIHSTYFYLTDEYAKYKIRVYFNDSNITLKKYEKVNIYAIFHYDASDFLFYMELVK